jgi:hypothetical protein
MWGMCDDDGAKVFADKDQKIVSATGRLLAAHVFEEIFRILEKVRPG